MKMYTLIRDHRTISSRGFTLVELIVVVVILAILSTIGFMTLKGYSSQSRDSKRVSDMESVEHMLETTQMAMWQYPAPDSAFNVTFSGWAAWYQGTIGDSVMTVARGAAPGGLSQKPVDPLLLSEYKYSTIAQGRAYQIAWNFEWTVVGLDIVPTTYASDAKAETIYLRGNYGGLAVKVLTGSTVCVVATPSLISNLTNTGWVVEISNNTLSGTLLFNGKSAVATTSHFNPRLVSCSANLPNSDTDLNTLVTNLKQVYTGTDIVDLAPVANLLAVSPGATTALGKDIIDTQLWGKVYSKPALAVVLDTTAPTITDITSASPSCNRVRITVNGAADEVALHATAYSFDAGSTWQSLDYKDYVGVSYTHPINQIKVRDTSGNIYTYANSVSGSSVPCTITLNVTGIGTTTLPVWSTSMSLYGNGGPGTVSTYNPGQPYIAPYNMGTLVSAKDSFGNENYNTWVVDRGCAQYIQEPYSNVSCTGFGSGPYQLASEDATYMYFTNTGVPALVNTYTKSYYGGQAYVAPSGSPATAGQNSTVVVGGTTYTFNGAASGVATPPSPTTQNPTLGAGPTTVNYNIAPGQTMRITYNIP